MKNVWDELGITKDELDNTSTSTGGALVTGLHKLTIGELFILKGNEQAKSLHINCEGDGNLFFKTNMIKKNGTPSIGVRILKMFTEALNIEPEFEIKKIKHFDDSVDAMWVENMIGKEVYVGVTEFEDDYSGSVKVKNDIILVLPADASDKDVEEAKEKLSKKSIKRLATSKATKKESNVW